MRASSFAQLASLLLGLSVANTDAAESKPVNPALLGRFEARVFTNAAGGRLNCRLFKPAISGVQTTLGVSWEW